MARETATSCTGSYLKAFRRCPDNPEMSLDIWRTHLWSDALPEQWKHLTDEVYKIWLQLRYRYLALTSENAALLQCLQQRFLLALITNGPSQAQWEKIQLLQLTKYFDCLLVSADLQCEKPAREIFFTACNYLGVAPHQCVMVGDKLETDIQGGIEANIGSTIWLPMAGDRSNITNGGIATPPIVVPDYTIQNLSELLTLLPVHTVGHHNFRSSSFGSGIRKGTLRNRRVASLPDLENCNSNSSDGS